MPNQRVLRSESVRSQFIFSSSRDNMPYASPIQLKLVKLTICKNPSILHAPLRDTYPRGLRAVEWAFRSSRCMVGFLQAVRPVQRNGGARFCCRLEFLCVHIDENFGKKEKREKEALSRKIHTKTTCLHNPANVEIIRIPENCSYSPYFTNI